MFSGSDPGGALFRGDSDGQGPLSHWGCEKISSSQELQAQSFLPVFTELRGLIKASFPLPISWEMWECAIPLPGP